jgi:hypothetical protein
MMMLNDVASHPVAYTNPIYLRDFADIGLLRRAEGYYAYASQGQTEAGMHNIQTAFSPDLVHWQPGPDPARLWRRLRYTRRVMILDPIQYREGWPYIPGNTPSLHQLNGPVQRG